MRKNISKKFIIITVAISVSILLVTSVLLYFLLREKFVFRLVGEQKVTLEIYEKYEELGIEAHVNKIDISKDVLIDSSKVDMNTLGTYEVTYSITYKDKNYILNRVIEVVDNKAPVLTLIGNEEVIIKAGNSYNELGCSAVDNYDTKVNDKIQIINYVNTNVTGLQAVSYLVTDESGNTSSITRKVIVVPKEYDNTVIDYTQLMDSNRITNMRYIDDGIYLEGYVKDNNGKFNIRLCNKDKKKCSSYEMSSNDQYYYYGNIKLDSLDNGTYYMWINSKQDEKVKNYIPMQYQIKRSRIGDKLVTFYYEENNVKLEIEDFEYLYDIVIDPGHGGNDTGAQNSITSEKMLNLEQSLYEKKRYEDHGLNVLLLRDDYSYGIVMGDESWPIVRRKAYAIGYYGAVSKITYSNHHNSSLDKSLTGWEIIVSTNSINDDLTAVYKLKEEWNKIYKAKEEHIRIYTRNYNTGTIFTKENNEKYYFTDYYAVIRLPYELFNIKNILYEGSYLSNYNDFNWYYNGGNWKKLSEQKIKIYVESLGIKYIEHTSLT